MLMENQFQFAGELILTYKWNLWIACVKLEAAPSSNGELEILRGIHFFSIPLIA